MKNRNGSKKLVVDDTFSRMGKFKRPTFALVLPTFDMVPAKFMLAMLKLQLPVNATSVFMLYENMEIGVARNQAVHDILGAKAMPRFVVWLSNDELPEWDALIRLWMEMENSWANGKHGWDILTSLVYLKQDPPEPVLWNKKIRADGHLIESVDYKSGDIVESDVADLGFGLMRTELFMNLPAPWFHTGFDVQHGVDTNPIVSVHTEDCYFFERVRDAGMRMGVHTGVRTGHLDVKTGIIY